MFLVIGLLIGGGSFRARGDLVVADFSTNNPIKVMAVGDSITDDCSVSGAWRRYLQPLLDTNNFPYVAVGRNSVFPLPGGFTKTRHEGYCGAVIAPPGAFAAYSYPATDNYLQKIVKDALAITNNRPHVLLLLIGTNDIGRGRNPYQVATNDMSVLLDIIFSNAPNVNIILSKITSLQSAQLGYSPFATNVPIYNAMLQLLVNQRRALGQNVFLADMFSAVDYNTMFLSDHVHPNTNGLKAMASEFAARIESICIRTNRSTSVLVHGGETWKYFDTGQDPGTNWMQTNYDDSGWSSGPARFGYGDFVSATSVSFGPDATNKYPATYFRRPFVVPDGYDYTNLNVRLARADGAAVWLNGQELFRTNLPAGPITYLDPATTTMTGYTAYVYFPTTLSVSNLAAGTNLIAVEVHQSALTNSLLGFDLELFASGYLIPPPVLAASLFGNRFQASWSMLNGAGYSLYSTTNLADGLSWTAVPAPLRTNGSTISAVTPLNKAERFFRLQKP
jgi:lysophospholipase L1-like esterase